MSATLSSLDWVVFSQISGTRVCLLFVLLSRGVILVTISCTPKPGPQFLWAHWFIYLSLVGIFLFKGSVSYFAMSEVSLLPISLIILGWGYQPERSSAFVYMFLFTVRAALPLLLILLGLGASEIIWDILHLSMFNTWTAVSRRLSLVICLFTVAAFLVKFPLYRVHLWLPKAHVEAPVTGSIVLAGLLLKLGGFGWFLVLALINNQEFNSIVSSFAGAGAVIIRFVCLRQVDLKVLIAYSSVSHLGVVIIVLRSSNSLGLTGGLLIIITHGFSSPGIFYGANCFYSRSRSRNILLNSASGQFTPIVSMWWFLLCMGNISAPPSRNLAAELTAINRLVNTDFGLRVLAGVLVFLAGAYTLVLYSGSQQGQKKPKFRDRSQISFIEQQTFLYLVLCVYFLLLVIILI